MMVATFNGNPRATIISCYSPTNIREETELIAFYDKHVDPANVLSLMRASNDSQRQWRKQRRGNKYNKRDDLLSDLQTCV